MIAVRVGADTTQPDVQRDQHPSSGGDYLRVGRAAQPLLADGVNVVTGAGQDGGRGGRQVLIELELHRDCGSGSSSSRASAAP
jgi:hypothetical protein